MTSCSPSYRLVRKLTPNSVISQSLNYHNYCTFLNQHLFSEIFNNPAECWCASLSLYIPWLDFCICLFQSLLQRSNLPTICFPFSIDWHMNSTIRSVNTPCCESILQLCTARNAKLRRGISWECVPGMNLLREKLLHKKGLVWKSIILIEHQNNFTLSMNGLLRKTTSILTSYVEVLYHTY